MTTEHIIIIILAVLLIAERLSHIAAERVWRTERRELCNRLQAGTLQDYAVNRQLVEPSLEAEEKPFRAETGSLELGKMAREAYEDNDLSASELAMAQAASDRILGDV